MLDLAGGSSTVAERTVILGSLFLFSGDPSFSKKIRYFTGRQSLTDFNLISPFIWGNFFINKLFRSEWSAPFDIFCFMSDYPDFECAILFIESSSIDYAGFSSSL